ncbi:BMP/retinoic acid-inducible neural-specific protein 3 isoform X1 [Myotis myotis]|uniref:BMP/retinoic acid inducible neural specific 3 n=2 Tax=Myotis myotis TaxID=51298 RepID=A0A7J7RTY5_MYOMY|nr:BMP/retinoic acid-inducible neural-specific protein 3 isoform X1 [Myotis myotis]XP_036211103.1 BMP/retinoic acid-inducible neural-specific protein 3 isoform X1 [Myotis myotis]XP_036211104.1 BMP/retinoic acid-inducible neural-specific protein 3 isoform X1 [Myotis myotis]KAF6279626.1 BMP/retinoic acid inducible neural specific 3 [Myotis myotis]
MIWRSGAGAEVLSLMALWEWIALSLHCWVFAVAAVSDQHATSPFDWLLYDKGPFHRSQEYTDFVDRSRQGFSTRYKIYREFGRWKVNNLAVERRNFLGSPLPLAPEFFRNIRLLGRRPTLQQITENLIKKYGTHFLVSATLGGEESLTIFVDKRKLSKGSEGADSGTNSSSVTLETLHQLAASYFIDRDSTLRRLHHIQIASTAIKVTETRTGPLGCSNYDNLDSVSSVLVQSPENKIQLQGLQALLPDYLQERFVQAALSYIACNSEGEFICKDNDCWCQCGPRFPECNCPSMDIQAMEENLLRITETWKAYNSDFEESDEFKFFMKRLPMNYFLNTSTIMHLWTMDSNFQRRYEQLENSMKQLFLKAQRIVHKLFSLSKRCHKQPLISLPRQRTATYWLTRIQSFLYCNENGLLGSFSEETHSCTCPSDQLACTAALPCTVGDAAACLACAPDNRTRCGACNTGYMLSQGLCKPEVAESTDHYIGFETDLQDLELKYLLQKTDRRLEVHAIFISNDMRLNSWFDPSWRKRMLLTLKSNKYKSSLVHMILGLSLQICLTKNSTLEPVLAVYINPFGGSHSESWFMPVSEDSFPDWERTRLDLPLQCYNWSLTLGNTWKTFFETVHIYLRSRIRSSGPNGNDSVYYEPLEFIDPARNLGYMKINHIQVFGYSMHFDPEAIRDLILQLDYPYTQGSQDSALLQLVEIRDRVNKLSPPGPRRLDLFSCLLRHRLKLATSEVVRIQAALQAFNAKLPNTVDYDTTKLCS